MPCKHQDGSDKCDRTKSGGCRVLRASLNAKYLTLSKDMGDRRHRHRVGAACESIVQADLLMRGFDLTKSISPGAKHDLHVDLPSVGWKGVQVKAARMHPTTGRVYFGGGAQTVKRGESPILALVLHDRTIRYEAGTEPLPKELEKGFLSHWQVGNTRYCECGEQLDLEPSLPAKRAVGFCGKAGGRTDGINR